MKLISLLLSLLLIASCISSDSNAIKTVCSNNKDFLANHKGKENYLIDTLFYDVDHMCHRYNNGFLLVLREKDSINCSPLIIIKDEGKLYMRLKHFVALDSVRLFPEKYDISEVVETNRISTVEEMIDFFEFYCIYAISINHQSRSISIDFGMNEEHENKYMYYYDSNDICYKITHDTISVCNNSVDYVFFSETIDSIAKGWSMRKTRVEEP